MSDFSLWLSILIALSLFFVVYWFYLRKPEPKDKLRPYVDSYYINILGQTIHYRDQGKGEAMVLIHGIGASTFVWRNLVPLLKSHFRILSIDLAGFGYSSKNKEFSHNIEDQAAIIEELLARLKIKKAHFVGSSMGGAIALWLCLKHPHLCLKTIVIAPAANPKHTKKLKLGPLAAFSKITLLNPFVIKQILARVLNKKNLITPQVVNEYLRPYKEDKDSIVCFTKAFDNLLADRRMPEIFKDIRSPVFILWGKRDRITNIRYGYELQKIISGSKLYTLKGGSHHLMEDEADWTAKKILEITH